MNTHNWLFYCCVFFGLLTPILAATNYFNIEFVWRFFLLGLGLIFLGSSVAVIFYKDQDARKHKIVKNAANFFRDIFSAPHLMWSCAIVGGFFAIIYMMFALGIEKFSPSYHPFTTYSAIQANTLGAVSVFFTGVGMIAILGAFHRRIAPFTDLWEWVDHIRMDMNGIVDKKKKTQVWWVYPGLGLGKYRSLKNDGSDEKEAENYIGFKKSFSAAFSDTNIEFKAIVYSKPMITAFYAAYHIQADANQSVMNEIKKYRNCNPPNFLGIAKLLDTTLENPKLQKCIQEESDLQDKKDTDSVILTIKQPEDLATVIVIGDVVYQIANYSAPIFKKIDDVAEFPEPFKEIQGIFIPSETSGDHLLQVMAFRRDDPEFARVVKRHLESVFRRIS